MSPPVPARQRPGFRGRIGIIQPSPGVMLEHEWPKWLPEDVLFPVMRVPFPQAGAAGFAAVAAQVPMAAAELARAGADTVAFACTLGSVFEGAAAEAALVGAIETASGKPGLSLGSASVAALRQLGARRIALLTPYAAEGNGWIAAYLEEAGFAVAGFAATPVDIVTVGNLPAAEIAALGVTAMAAHPEADTLWIPCTAIRTLDAIDAIEATCRRPVVSGSQALLWQALAGLGIAAAGPGALFR